MLHHAIQNTEIGKKEVFLFPPFGIFDFPAISIFIPFIININFIFIFIMLNQLLFIMHIGLIGEWEEGRRELEKKGWEGV